MTGFRGTLSGHPSVEIAARDGYRKGRHDIGGMGQCKYLYRTAAEYRAWLTGWRQGQAELKLELAARAGILAAMERLAS